MNVQLLSPDELAALWLSLKVGLWCVIGSVIPGVACGWLMARRQFLGKPIVDALIHLPLVVPPVVTGYLLLVLLGRNGMLGRPLHEWLGVEIAFTWVAAALASAVMGFPLLVRATRLAIELVDPHMEEAARTLGAGGMRVFLTVTLPLAFPGVMAGMVLCFARSLGEFGATIMFAGNIAGQTRTLPLALYTATQVPGGEGTATRLVIISLALAVAALIASEFMARKVARRLGRP